MDKFEVVDLAEGQLDDLEDQQRVIIENLFGNGGIPEANVSRYVKEQEPHDFEMIENPQDQEMVDINQIQIRESPLEDQYSATKNVNPDESLIGEKGVGKSNRSVSESQLEQDTNLCQICARNEHVSTCDFSEKNCFGKILFQGCGQKFCNQHGHAECFTEQRKKAYDEFLKKYKIAEQAKPDPRNIHFCQFCEPSFAQIQKTKIKMVYISLFLINLVIGIVALISVLLKDKSDHGIQPDSLKCPEFFYMFEQSCIQDTCEDPFFVGSSGKCEECDTGYKLLVDRCVIICSKSQKRSYDGLFCMSLSQQRDCPDYMDLINEKCTIPTCETNFRITEVGQCEKCPLKTYLKDNKCISDTCKPDEILGDDGRCVQCKSKFYVSNDKCVQDYCNPDLKEYVNEKGICLQCGDYLYTEYDWSDYHNQLIGTGCRQKICPSSEILLKNGQCKVCPQYTHVDQTGKECVSENCQTNLGQYLDQNGKCQYCKDYTYATDNGCIQDSCLPNEKLRIDGKCIACPDYYHVDQSGKQCVQDSCDSRSIHKLDGSCQLCPLYTHPSDDIQCVSDTCGPRDILTEDGICFECPDYEEPQEHNCVKNDCTIRYNQYTKIDGTCGICDEMFYRDDTGKGCQQDTCTQGYELQNDGKCHECQAGFEIEGEKCVKMCGEYYYRSEDGQSCLQEKCETQFYVDVTGKKCVQDRCEEYFYNDENGKCQQAVCQEGELLGKNGKECYTECPTSYYQDGNKCNQVYCPDDQRPDSTGTACQDAPFGLDSIYLCDHEKVGNNPVTTGNNYQSFQGGCDTPTFMKSFVSGKPISGYRLIYIDEFLKDPTFKKAASQFLSSEQEDVLVINGVIKGPSFLMDCTSQNDSIQKMLVVQDCYQIK